MMIALLIFLPALAIAGWLAFLFARKGQYEKAVAAFLSMMLLPVPAWYVGQWLSGVLTGFLYDRFYSGGLYGTMPPLAQGVADILEFLAPAAMIGSFAWICLYWARRGQRLEEESLPLASKSVADAEDASTAFKGEESIHSRLHRLEQLRRDGLISDDEYASKRSEIIARI